MDLYDWFASTFSVLPLMVIIVLVWVAITGEKKP